MTWTINIALSILFVVRLQLTLENIKQKMKIQKKHFWLVEGSVGLGPLQNLLWQQSMPIAT